MSYLKRLCRNFKGDNAEETVILMTVAGIFLPYIVSALFILFAVLRTVFVKDVRKAVYSQKDFKYIWIFAILNFSAPLLFKNYLGFACYFGVIAILIFALYCRKYMTQKLLNKIFDISAFLSMCCAIPARIQKEYVDPPRPASMFLNANYYGAMITFVVLICFYRILTKNANIFYMIFTIMMNLYGLHQADSQTSFFCIFFGMWLMLLLMKYYKTFSIITLMGIIGLIILPQLTFIFPRILDAKNNLTIRSKIWLAGIKSFCENPIFGRGMMGYMQIFERFGSQKNFHCHNLIIDLLHSFGAIGSIPLLVFVLKNILYAKGKKYSPLFFAIVGAVMLHGMVDVTIGWIQTGAYAAMLLSTAYIDKKDGQIN